MSQYYIEPIGPGMVRVHEHEVSYPMTQAEAEANLAVVQASRQKYASDTAYLRRVEFYEDVLNALNAKGV